MKNNRKKPLSQRNKVRESVAMRFEKNTPLKKTTILPGINKYKNYILAVIILFTAIIYWPSLQNGFVAGDDYTLLVNNPDIQSLRNIPKFFTQPYHFMYCPVKMVSHAIDYQFTELNPTGYHFFSLLYHLINVALVFYLIFLLLPNAWAAGIAALLFAIHPMNVETVDWLTGRGDLLYGGFYIAGLITYLLYLRKGYQTKHFLFTFLFFVLSALSKASAMTFPLALVLLDWYYHRKLFSKRIILEKIPFFFGAIALGISAILMRGSQHSVSLSDYFTRFSSIVDYLVIFLYPLAFYMVKFFAPAKLALPYPHPFASDLPLSPDFYIYPFLLVILIILIGRFKSIRRPLAFALLFYVVALISAMRLSPMLGTIAADRYFYLPIIGIVFFMAWMFLYLSEHRNLWKKKAYPVFIALVVLFAGTMTMLTYQRIKVFKNGITLFGDAHEKYPQHATPLYELTGAYMQEGDYKNALLTAQKVTALLPQNEGAYGFYTNLLLAGKQYSEALKNIDKLIRINPSNTAYYISKAQLFQQLNQLDSALVALENAIHNSSDENLTETVKEQQANIYMAEKRYAEAIALYTEIIEKLSSPYTPLMNRAISNFESGNQDAAIQDMLALIQHYPIDATAYSNLGKMYSFMGRHDEACANWRKAAEYGATDVNELLKNCN